MRLATKSLGMQSARPSNLAVAPPPSNEPVASPLHQEQSARPSASDVASPPSDEPVASPLHRETSARPSALAAMAPPSSNKHTTSPLLHEGPIRGNGAAWQTASMFSHYTNIMLDFEAAEVEIAAHEANCHARIQEIERGCKIKHKEAARVELAEKIVAIKAASIVETGTAWAACNARTRDMDFSSHYDQIVLDCEAAEVEVAAHEANCHARIQEIKR